MILLMFGSATAGVPDGLGPYPDHLPGQPGEPGDHCNSDERVLFTCDMATNDRVLSICGPQIIPDAGGYAVYRYGRLDEVELAWPQTPTLPSKAFKSATEEHHLRADGPRAFEP